MSGAGIHSSGQPMPMRTSGAQMSALALQGSDFEGVVSFLETLDVGGSAQESSLDILGESPVWCPVRQCLFWIDIRRHLLRCWSPTGVLRQWTLPEITGAVVLGRNATLVVALRNSLHRLDPDIGVLSRLLQVEQDRPHNRLNDAKVDRSGHLWCGSMWDYGAGPTGVLYQVGPDLQPHMVRAPVTIPNAIAFSPDCRWMYFADSSLGAIERAPFEPGVGVGAWEILVPAGLVPGKPDGLTVDSEGGLWNARFGAGLVTRFHADGSVDRSISLPVTQPTSCAFGGAGLDQLFVTTARQRLGEVELSAQPLAGCLLVLETGMRGLAEPSF